MEQSSKSSSFLSSFQRFNLFGTPLQIRFNNVQMHKTYFGSLMTLMISIVLIIYSYYIIVDCLTYARPNVIFQEKSIALPSAFQLNPQKFSLAMGIQDQSLVHFIDEKIYFLDVVFRETIKVLNTTTNQYDQQDIQTPIKMIPCTINHFQVEGTQEYFMKLKYENLYCFPLDKQLYLEGQFGAMAYRRLQIRVRYCVENCVDQQIIKQKLSNFAFQIYYVNYSIKSTDKNNPFQAIGQNTFWQTGYSLYKTTINSDFGLFQQDFYSDERLLYSFDRETIITQTDNKMFEMFVNLEKNKESEYIRTYTKLQNGFSQIGGIFNILFCLGCMVSLPFTRSSLEQHLMNKVFNFKESRERIQTNFNNNENYGEMSIINNNKNQKLASSLQNIQNRVKQDSSIIMKNNIEQNVSDKQIYKSVSLHQQLRDQRLKRFSIQKKNQNTDSLDIIQQNSMQLSKIIGNNPTESQEQQQKNQSENKSPEINVKMHSKFTNKLSNAYNNISITMKNLITSKFSSILRGNQAYTRMVNYGIEKLYSQFDVEYIMNKLIEIEKLKYLLLNENQLKLFEFIPKPTIYLSDFQDQVLEQKIMKLSTKIKDSSIPKQNLSNSQPRFSLLNDENRNKNQITKDVEEAFYQIYKVEKSASRVDQKLMDLLDSDHIKLLETSINEKTQVALRQDYNTSQNLIQIQTQPTEKQVIALYNTQISDNEQLIKYFDQDQDQEISEYRTDVKQCPSELKSYKLFAKDNSLRFQ